MNTKTLSKSALSMIEHYLHFQIGPASCSVPYFNNKTTLTRMALGVHVGKGTPRDISDEIQTILIKAHVSYDSLTAASLKQALTDHNLGIDCSGFVYHVLDAQVRELTQTHLRTHISFVYCTGLMGMIRARLRPIENCDVATYAHDANSTIVPITDITPGDLITMQSADTTHERDHILIIHQVDYRDMIPSRIYYSHAVAYPEDGVYGTGIKQGTIEIIDTTRPITAQLWTEDGMRTDANRIYLRAHRSRTEIRRIRPNT